VSEMAAAAGAVHLDSVHPEAVILVELHIAFE
jgi:hypothetical protein